MRRDSVIARPTRPPSPRIVAVWILAVLVTLAVVVGQAPSVRSQTTDTIPEGTYSGGIYLKMNTAFIDLAAGGSGTLENRADAAGDAAIIIDSEASSMSGTWTLEGSGTYGGTGDIDGVLVTFSGGTTTTGSGTFFGTQLEGRLVGTATTSGQLILTSSFGTTDTSNDRVDEYNEPLTDLLNACSQLLARWDSELTEKLEAASGGDIEVTVKGIAGYLVLSDAIVITQESGIADQMRALATQGNSTLGDARAGGDGLVALVDGVDILLAVEQLQADIANKESDCPTDKAFINILTLVAQDALDTMLIGFESGETFQPNAEILRTMVRLGQGTGAMGSGAKDMDRAFDLESRMEALANEAFEEATRSDAEDIESAINEAISLAALGEQQGWNLENSVGITSADVLATGADQ